MIGILKKAIDDHKCVKFNYGGGMRIIEPYLIGITSKNNEVLRAYQIEGYSSSKIPSWKEFKIYEISNIIILDKIFLKRPEYNPNDKNMIRIIYALK